ncbi:hypothetical protein [Kitasatospora kazusensis]
MSGALAAWQSSLWMPGREHGERDFPKVTAPSLDPGSRKNER